ncbi:hypothetical protein DFH09DRAFT_934081 [Mycena vulgaris]|nr:hypothetical protein DFH09DRAFT_934081 [Mycena vulgaris]
MPSQCSECGASIHNSSSDDINVTTKTLVRQQELLTTNTPPKGAELTFLRAVVSDTTARLTDVEKEITRLRDRLKQLEDERVSLTRYRGQNTGILSPLRRMPSEILAQFFLWTLSSVHTLLDCRKFTGNESPWVLAQVSHR